MSISIGDKVLYGKYLGVVRIVVEDNDDIYGVEFGSDFRGGHSCLHKIPSGRGWWCHKGDLKVINSGVVKTKKDLIIDKIKYLDKKFEERYKNEHPF